MDVRRVLAPSEDLGESPLLPAAALVTAAVLYADLPTRFIAGHGAGTLSWVRWVVPALTLVVILALGMIRTRGPLARALDWGPRALHLTRRRLALTTIAIVSAANAASIIVLVHLLIHGVSNKATAAPLLRAGVHMWVGTSSRSPFGTGSWTAVGRSAARPACRTSATSSFHSTPNRCLPGRAGGRSSSTISMSRYERRSVQPDRHHAAQPLGEDADARPVGHQPRARGDGRGEGREHPWLTRPVLATRARRRG